MKIEPVELIGTDSEQAYQRIRLDIVRANLPAGGKLKIVDLKARYGLGAAPLREALSRLVGDRLVEVQNQRGFRVKDISAEDVQDVGETRILLETEALRRSIASGTDDWEANIMAAYHRLQLVERIDPSERDPELLERRNQEFHDALVAAAGSTSLLQVRAQIYAHHERYRYISRRASSAVRDTPSEHAGIFGATMKRQTDLACDLTRRHIELTTETALKALGDSVSS